MLLSGQLHLHHGQDLAMARAIGVSLIACSVGAEMGNGEDEFSFLQ